MPVKSGHEIAIAGSAMVASLVVHTFDAVAWWATGSAFVSLLLLMSLDLAMRVATHPAKHRENFPWMECLKAKYLILILVAISAVVDGMMYFVASALPGNFAVLEEGWMIVTLATLLWFIGGELWSTISIYQEAHEDHAAPPHLSVFANHIRWVFQGVKKVDKKRWSETHEDGEPTPERWTDKLANMTDSQAERLAILLQEMDDEQSGVDPTDVPEAVDSVPPGEVPKESFQRGGDP